MAETAFSGDDYVSPSASAGSIAARFPTLFFLWKVFGIIRHDGNLAEAGKYYAANWVDGSRNTLRALEHCGAVLHVEGLRHIDAVDGPCVFVGNHMSTLETFILPVFIQPRKEVTYIVKESLLGYPWFGSVLKSRDPVVVSRTNPRRDLTTVLEGGEERLKRGISIIVFPQSTRNATFETAGFNSMGIKLAKRAGVPVIPLALRTDAWSTGRLLKDFGRINPALPIHFAFGEALYVKDNGKAEHAAVCTFIEQSLRRWQDEPPCPPQPAK
ncbi:MAG: 1-acyl-sn-glycerol-3-phosphate acyltransferase [Desulfovibrio sp.]|nr:1-acyl-sn-glycerol-3-phosphate acyltransferase [Desulfovibrio sp.]